MHSPKPLSISEILRTMPTDQSISAICMRMTRKEKLSGIIPDWNDAIVWSELHRSSEYPNYWD